MKKIIMKDWFHTIIFCILVIIASFAIYNITHEVLTQIHVEQRLAETIGRILACIGLLGFYKKFFSLEEFGLRRKNFLQGVIIGGFMILATLDNLEVTMIEVSDYPVVLPSLYLIIIVIVEQIFVGVFEEFLFRGVVLNILLKKFRRKNHRNKMLAIMISSVLFGMVHLLNLFSEPQMLVATIDQVFYSIFIGVFLAALYLRLNNIWLVVFYHFIYNIVTELPVLFYQIPVEATGDQSIPDAILNIAVSSSFLFVGLFIARKSKETTFIEK